jgi:hypothetical protein
MQSIHWQSVRTSLRPLVRWAAPLFVAGATAGLAGCAATVEPAVGVPVNYYEYPYTYYDGHVVYYMRGGWYYPYGNRWYRYRRVPDDLYYRRYYYDRPPYGYGRGGGPPPAVRVR